MSASRYVRGLCGREARRSEGRSAWRYSPALLSPRLGRLPSVPHRVHVERGLALVPHARRRGEGGLLCLPDDFGFLCCDPEFDFYSISRMPPASKCTASPQKKLAKSIYYEQFTKTEQSSGPENIGPERPLSARRVPRPVLSPSRITLENNGKIRSQPVRENAFARASGGGDGPAVEPSPLDAI